MINFLKYSLKVIRYNLKIYINMIIVLIISFSFCFGVLLYFDEKSYDENKFISAKPNQLITISNPNSTKNNIIKRKMRDNNEVFLYSCSQQGTSLQNLEIEIYMIPKDMKNIYLDDMSHININSNNEIADLKEGEVYLHKSFYDLYKKIKYINLPIRMSNGENIIKRYFVKGYFEIDGEMNQINDVDYSNESTSPTGRTSVIINKISNKDVFEENTFDIIYSKNIEKTLSILRQINVEYNSVLELKNDMKNNMRTIIVIETIVMILVYIFLGFNVKSIVANTFEKRKYEISVQRTIGAKRINIIAQYIIESVIVTFFSIIISSGIVLYFNCILKLFALLKGRELTIFMSNRSIIIYIVSCIGIMVYVNYLFISEVLNVEIIKFLKKN